MEGKTKRGKKKGPNLILKTLYLGRVSESHYEAAEGRKGNSFMSQREEYGWANSAVGSALLTAIPLCSGVSARAGRGQGTQIPASFPHGPEAHGKGQV